MLRPYIGRSAGRGMACHALAGAGFARLPWRGRFRAGEMKNRRSDTRAKTGLKPPRGVARGPWLGRERGGLRVLLVEDDPDHALLVRQMLENDGHAVIAVSQGQAAIAALGENTYDVVALDYHLPDITGLEALDLIKRHDGAVPVVMVTAGGSEQVAVEALKKGAGDYVVKTPGYERELVRALELAAEKARADSAEQTLRAELQQRATTDALTGLLNRGEMEHLLKSQTQQPDRAQAMFALVLIDVDDFKAINDTHGHPMGDEVLRRVGQILRRSTRSSDFVARWGGDEFAVLLPAAGLAAAKAFTDRMRRLASRLPATSKGQHLPAISLSAGVACVTSAAGDPAEILKCADRALYAAKAGAGHGARFSVVDGRKRGKGKGDGGRARRPRDRRSKESDREIQTAATER